MTTAAPWSLIGLLALTAGCSIDEQHQAASDAGACLQADLVVTDRHLDRPGSERVFVSVYNLSRITYRDVPWFIIHPHYPNLVMASGTIASIAPRCEVTALVALPRLTALEVRTLTLIVAPCVSLCQASPDDVRTALTIGQPPGVRGTACGSSPGRPRSCI